MSCSSSSDTSHGEVGQSDSGGDRGGDGAVGEHQALDQQYNICTRDSSSEEKEVPMLSEFSLKISVWSHL